MYIIQSKILLIIMIINYTIIFPSKDRTLEDIEMHFSDNSKSLTGTTRNTFRPLLLNICAYSDRRKFYK